MNFEITFCDHAKAFLALSDELQGAQLQQKVGNGYCTMLDKLGKEVSPEEEEDLTCYLEYRNLDRQEHGVG